MMRLTWVAAASALLASCASFSPDGGFSPVGEMTLERTGKTPSYQRAMSDVDSAKARTAELLKQVLSADDAVELAYLNNRGLQASFSELGIAEAAFVQAGRLRNPRFSLGRLRGDSTVEIDRAVVFDVVGLLTMPLSRQLEHSRLEQAQFQAASDAVGVAWEVRRAYFNAVAAQERVAYFQQVQEAAEAANELAQRMVAAGNFNRLAQMREQLFRAEATSDLARARHQAVAERERLSRLLGVSGEQLNFQLPEHLPDLPARPAEPQDAEQTAVEKRLDILMAKRTAESTAKALGLTRATRFVNVLEVGYQNKSETASTRSNGYEIELELPLFDFGAARTARAQALYMQAVNRTAAIALNARSEVRESYSAYRTAYDLARHYRDEVVPLRKRISEEKLRRYNGMLASVFELLADSREQVRGVNAYVEALRDFWTADANLQIAITGRSPGASEASRPATSPSEAGGAVH